MRKIIAIALSILAATILLSACGGKKKSADVKNESSDSKTSATASYDPGNKTQPDSLKTPAP
jgi:ABC-type glycerol-3-phosphate transport system substrate-binding protein